MKKLIAMLSLALVLVSPSAFSRDTKVMLPINELMASQAYIDKLNKGVGFYFGEQSTPSVLKNLGNFTTNKKTNAFNKSDEVACRHVLLSALMALQDRALREGGNAVINIVSYYKNSVHSSTTELECHAGGIMAGAALKGDAVKLAN